MPNIAETERGPVWGAVHEYDYGGEVFAMLRLPLKSYSMSITEGELLLTLKGGDVLSGVAFACQDLMLAADEYLREEEVEELLNGDTPD